MCACYEQHCKLHVNQTVQHEFKAIPAQHYSAPTTTLHPHQPQQMCARVQQPSRNKERRRQGPTGQGVSGGRGCLIRRLVVSWRGRWGRRSVRHASVLPGLPLLLLPLLLLLLLLRRLALLLLLLLGLLRLLWLWLRLLCKACIRSEGGLRKHRSGWNIIASGSKSASTFSILCRYTKELPAYRHAPCRHNCLVTLARVQRCQEYLACSRAALSGALFACLGRMRAPTLERGHVVACRHGIPGVEGIHAGRSREPAVALGHARAPRLHAHQHGVEPLRSVGRVLVPIRRLPLLLHVHAQPGCWEHPLPLLQPLLFLLLLLRLEVLLRGLRSPLLPGLPLLRAVVPLWRVLAIAVGQLYAERVGKAGRDELGVERWQLMHPRQPEGGILIVPGTMVRPKVALPRLMCRQLQPLPAHVKMWPACTMLSPDLTHARPSQAHLIAERYWVTCSTTSVHVNSLQRRTESMSSIPARVSLTLQMHLNQQDGSRCMPQCALPVVHQCVLSMHRKYLPAAMSIASV